MQTLHLHIHNMNCQNCVHHVTEALESVEGINNIHVDLPTKQVEISYDEAKVDKGMMVQVLDKIGYTAE